MNKITTALQTIFIALTISSVASSSPAQVLGKAQVEKFKKEVAGVQSAINEAVNVAVPGYGLLQPAKSAYIEGYGAIFTLEVAFEQPRNPFNSSKSPDQVRTLVAQRRKEMREKLVALIQEKPSILGSLLPAESMAIVVYVVNSNPADLPDLPGSIVISVKKQDVLDQQASRITAAELSKQGVDPGILMNTLLAIETRPLGQRLRDRGLISEEDLKNALTLQQERRDKLGRILIDLGYVSERDVISVLSEQLEVEIFAGEYPAVPIEDPALPYRFLRAFHTLPVHLDNGVLSLVMADPLDLETRSAIRLRTGFALRIYLAGESEILEQLERLYGGDESANENLIETIGDGFGGDENVEHLRDLALEVPVIRMVNLIIARAVESRSSDIHIEPFEKDLRLRYRVDGVLHNIDPPPNQLRAAIISRIKLMAKLNIAERRLPQDGRIKLKVLGKEIDLRVSTLPTMYGESVVMRILDQSNSSLIDLRRLGFSEDLFAKVCQMTAKPHGIFLVTGPTGSGKSTTLYSALKRINISDKKIITIEDPVEYQMDGINQIQTNPQIGLTFGSGLRHIVRQDPDVIMIGEIRDLETAEIAIRSALTGHLVFSTLHTNDAASAVTRLVDMGVEDYLLASSLIGILAQRLVRVNCPECKISQLTPASGLRDAGFPVEGMGDLIELQRGAGCEHCGQTGYKSRLGIFELIEINEEFRRLMVTKADATVLLSQAIRSGMRTLKEDGWLKILNGTTTPDEVLRVTQEV